MACFCCFFSPVVSHSRHDALGLLDLVPHEVTGLSRANRRWVPEHTHVAETSLVEEQVYACSSARPFSSPQFVDVGGPPRASCTDAAAGGTPYKAQKIFFFSFLLFSFVFRQDDPGGRKRTRTRPGRPVRKAAGLAGPGQGFLPGVGDRMRSRLVGGGGVSLAPIPGSFSTAQPWPTPSAHFCMRDSFFSLSSLPFGPFSRAGILLCVQGPRFSSAGVAASGP